MTRMLLVLTSHDRLGPAGPATGYWKEELTVPHRRFRAAGIDVDVASIAGGRPPVDPNSDSFVTPDGPDAELDAAVAATLRLAEVDPDRYDGTLLVGGHGTMWDFTPNPALDAIVGAIAVTGIVASVCHGAAGLLGAVGPDGVPLVAGRSVTAFSDAEEVAVGADAVIPFSLERRLVELGAHVEVGAPFAPHVRQHGRLVTGQNPASSADVADLVIETLSVGARR